jgi:hypothetical protein
LYWYHWFFDHTESFEGELALELAYLWPAILADQQIDTIEQGPVVQLLRQHGIDRDQNIWRYLKIDAGQM